MTDTLRTGVTQALSGVLAVVEIFVADGGCHGDVAEGSCHGDVTVADGTLLVPWCDGCVIDAVGDLLLIDGVTPGLDLDDLCEPVSSPPQNFCLCNSLYNAS